LALVHGDRVMHGRRVAWHLRAIEVSGGGWSCRWGAKEFDQHLRLEDAISHLRTIAASIGPAHFFAHRLDGTVERLD
jgi:hypothetical protein